METLPTEQTRTPSSNKPKIAASTAAPPETLEGWYVLHQLFSVDRDKAAHVSKSNPTSVSSSDEGWTALVSLIGSRADVMVVHCRPTLDGIGEAQRAFSRLPAARALVPSYSFLSVTEAGLYSVTAKLARKTVERGGTVGDETYVTDLAAAIDAEKSSPHVQKRLYPPLPDDMPYVCFYPMSKRRVPGQNWYELSLDERSRLMYSHGMTGRRYSGRILQIISGSIGFEAWEWGVTLFGRDPLDFKKLVTEMRFDEASAVYAEFGDFYVGKLVPGGDLSALIETIAG